MSNVKKVPFAHSSKLDPPRYQPPPQPPGILKHYPPPPPHLQNPYLANNVKDDKVSQLRAPNVGVEAKAFLSPPQYSAPPPVTSKQVPNNYQDKTSEMLKFVRMNKSDTEGSKMPVRVTVPDNQQKIDQTTRRVQSYIAEIRSLKEVNQRLSDDNQELRDLCCFLDDDRQKGRKLAREWQRFGRYTASVMRQEVSAYQNKLRELDNKQQELIKDNLELKELCLYLDEERNQNVTCPNCGTGLPMRPGHRDEGDGSSSSTNADEPGVATYPQQGPRRTESRERLLEESVQRQRNVFNEQIIQYVKSLEQRVKLLEQDKQNLIKKLIQNGFREDELNCSQSSWGPTDEVACGRPEAVVKALQVLEVRELIERSTLSDPPVQRTTVPDIKTDMDDGEKALVREMCNVVWRKLEEGSAGR